MRKLKKKKRHWAVLVGRMGDSFDGAYSVAFLTSGQTMYIAGQNIVVDGGVTASTG